MNVSRVFSRRCGGESINPIAVGAFVRQSALDQPVEDAIERYAIKRRLAQRQFDLVMS